MGTFCRFESDGGVGVVTLDRPEVRNALDVPTLDDLVNALKAAAGGCSVVVLTGTGRTFCAGADITKGQDATPGDPRARRRLIEEALDLVAELPISIAAVRGAAIGAGWALALACDVCLAAPATTFRFPEISLGFSVPDAALARLAARTDVATAFSVVAQEQAWSAEALQGMRLVEVVPDESLVSRAMQLASALATKDQALLARTKLTIASAVAGVQP